MKRKVVVIGGPHHNTLGVIRSLGRKGLRPYVILTGGGYLLRSKYIEKYWIVDNSEKAIDKLLEEFNDDIQKTVVIACNDRISSSLDIHRQKLLPYFLLPGIEETGKVSELMNKQLMAEIAKSSGLNIPSTLILNDELIHNCEGISFPCITKPIKSCKGSKSQIKVCSEIKELELFLSSNKGKDFLIQSFVTKEKEFQLIGCSLHSGKEIIIPGVSEIIRQPATTNTGFLHYTKLDETYNETLNNTKMFIQSIGYSGLFSVEYLRDKDGVDYFMEINFRNDGNAIAVTNAGVNLPYIWYLSCIGEDYSKEVNQIHEEWVMPEFDELSLYVNGIISYRQLRDDMKIATSYMDYAPDDPEPTNGWKRYMKSRVKAHIRRFLQQISNK